MMWMRLTSIPLLQLRSGGLPKKGLGQMRLFCIYFPSYWPIKGRFSSYEQTGLCSFAFLLIKKRVSPLLKVGCLGILRFFGLLEMIGAVHISTDLAETLTSINLKIFTSCVDHQTVLSKLLSYQVKHHQ